MLPKPVKRFDHWPVKISVLEDFRWDRDTYPSRFSQGGWTPIDELESAQYGLSVIRELVDSCMVSDLDLMALGDAILSGASEARADTKVLRDWVLAGESPQLQEAKAAARLAPSLELRELARKELKAIKSVEKKQRVIQRLRKQSTTRMCFHISHHMTLLDGQLSLNRDEWKWKLHNYLMDKFVDADPDNSLDKKRDRVEIAFCRAMNDPSWWRWKFGKRRIKLSHLIGVVNHACGGSA